MIEAIPVFTGASPAPPTHPFAISAAIARSLNRARIAALPGVAVDEGVIGRSAYDLLSAIATRSLIRDAAGSLGLDGGDPELLRSFNRCFDDPAARLAAVRISELIGRRLGYVLLMLARGDPANRAARPEWNAAHWTYWATVNRVIIGGGLWAGRLGDVALPAARAVLRGAECPITVERSPLGQEIALIGLARHMPHDTERALLFDFGQTVVKRGLATYRGGVLIHVEMQQPLDAPCEDHRLRASSLAEAQNRWRRMATIVTEDWAAVHPHPEGARTAINLCLATHLHDGHPFSTDRGCYGQLQDLAPRLATYMRDDLHRRLGRFRSFGLLQDGLAAASVHAGELRTVVLTLGTAIGAGYVPPDVGLRPLDSCFSPVTR